MLFFMHIFGNVASESAFVADGRSQSLKKLYKSVQVTVFQFWYVSQANWDQKRTTMLLISYETLPAKSQQSSEKHA